MVILLLFGTLVIMGAETNLDDLGLTGYATLGSYLSVGTYALIGTHIRVGDEVRSSGYQLGCGSVRTDSLGRVTVAARNKSGAARGSGRVVELDTTFVTLNQHKILPQIAYVDTGGIITTEGAPVALRLTAAGTPSNDSAYVYGTVLTGLTTTAAATEVLNFGTTANDIRFSSYLWTDIDSIKYDSGAVAGMDSLKAAVCSAFGVNLVDASTFKAFGVIVSDTVADNGLCEVCIYGATKVDCKTAAGTYFRPGFPLVCGASGSALPLAAASWATVPDTNIVGFGIASKDDVSDTAKVWIFVNCR